MLTLPVEQLIREELLVLVSSESFSRAQTLVNLLKYIVERTLDGTVEELKEAILGEHVLGRGAGFNPKTDPIVRVQVARLRTKLESYYAEEGHGARVLIEIPKGAYVATFRVRAEDTAQASTAPVRKVPKLAIALLVASAVAGGITLAVRRPWVDRPVPSVALVSFADLSQTHDQRYLSDGISQQLVHALTRISGLKVVGGDSAFQFRSDTVDLPEVARKLGVSYVIKGSVQGSGTRIRVEAGLIKTSDGSYAWSNTYDTSLGDVFSLEDKVASAVATALALEVSTHQGGSTLRRPIDAKAYDLYLRGLSHLNDRSAPGMHAAAAYFEQALRIDPNFAEAYAGLADVYSELGEYGFDPLESSISKSKMYALRALELDGNLAQAHASLGLIKSVYEWNWADATKEFNLALAEDPNNSNARLWYGTMLYVRGKNEAAVEQLNRALVSDPLSIPINTTLGWAHYNGRKADLALQYAAKALDLDPQSVPALALVVYGHMMKRNFPQAIEACREVQKVIGPGPRATWYYGLVYALSGDRTKAEEAIRELSSGTHSPGFRPIYLATIHATLHQNDQALHWLNEALTAHDPYLPLLYADPLTDPLRSDPRFAEILRKINM